MNRLVATALALMAPGCGRADPAAAPSASDAASQVSALADAYGRDCHEAFPDQAIALAAPEHPDRLVDHSVPALQRWADRFS